MKFLPGYTDPFLSPVTGRLRGEFALPDLPLGYVWMGGKDGRPVKTYKLIDHEIDIQFIKQHWRDIADVIHFDKQTGDIKTKGNVEAKGVGVLDTLGQVARFVAPLVLASPYDMTLPTAPGVPNQVLTQGTESQLEWKNIAAVQFDVPMMMDALYGTLTNLNGSLGGFSSLERTNDIYIRSSYYFGGSDYSKSSLSLLNRYDRGYRIQNTSTESGEQLAIQSIGSQGVIDIFSFDDGFSVHNHTIDNVPLPLKPQQVASKAYVDGIFQPQLLMDIVYGTMTNLNGNLAGFMSTRQSHEVKIKNSFFYGDTATAINALSFLDRYDQGYSLQTTHNQTEHTFSLNQRTGNTQDPVFSFDSIRFSTHGHTIDDLPLPTAPLHAVNKAYVDGISGGIKTLYAGEGLAATPSNPLTGTGTLYIPDQWPSPAGNYPFLNATINAKGFVTHASRGTPASTNYSGIPVYGDTQGTTLLNTPVQINTLGSEMAMNSYRISALGEPYFATDATNKKYVDDLWGGLQVSGTRISPKVWGEDIVLWPQNRGRVLINGFLELQPDRTNTGTCGLRFQRQYSYTTVGGGGGYVYVDGQDRLSYADGNGDHKVYHSGSPVIKVGDLWLSGDTIFNASRGDINIDPYGSGSIRTVGVVEMRPNASSGECGIRLNRQYVAPQSRSGTGYLYVNDVDRLSYADGNGSHEVYHSGSPTINVGVVQLGWDGLTNPLGGDVNIASLGTGQVLVWGVMGVKNSPFAQGNCGIYIEPQTATPPPVYIGGYLYVTSSGQLRFSNLLGDHSVAG